MLRIDRIVDPPRLLLTHWMTLRGQKLVACHPKAHTAKRVYPLAWQKFWRERTREHTGDHEFLVTRLD